MMPFSSQLAPLPWQTSLCVYVCVYCVNTSRRPVFILDYPIMPQPLPPLPTARISAVCQHRQAKTSTHMQTHAEGARPCVLLLFTSQGTEQKAKWALRQKEKKHSVFARDGCRQGNIDSNYENTQ